MLRLIELLRQEVSTFARPRDVECVLRSFDELVTFAIQSGVTAAAELGLSRARQRRRRVRRLTEQALQRLNTRIAAAERRDLSELAVLLRVAAPPNKFS